MAILLPELGRGAQVTDRATLFEAIRCALASLSGQGAMLLVLDDLHWSDAATLELLAGLAEPLAEMPVAMLGAYRSDGLPRDHGIRRLRNELRRAGRLEEIALEPLTRDQVRELLEAELGGAPPRRSPALCMTAAPAFRSSSRSWRARWSSRGRDAGAQWTRAGGRRRGAAAGHDP